jgi:NCS1 family nucleobase:cation symporter-1
MYVAPLSPRGMQNEIETDFLFPQSCPWNLASGANAFGNYLSAYSVFLSSMCVLPLPYTHFLSCVLTYFLCSAGVLIAHYYVIAGRKIRVADLYTKSKEGIYYYQGGVNYRAFAACSFSPASFLPFDGN